MPSKPFLFTCLSNFINSPTLYFHITTNIIRGEAFIITFIMRHHPPKGKTVATLMNSFSTLNTFFMTQGQAENFGRFCCKKKV